MPSLTLRMLGLQWPLALHTKFFLANWQGCFCNDTSFIYPSNSDQIFCRVNRLWAGWLRNHSSTPGKDRKFFSFSNFQTTNGAYADCCSVGLRGSFPRSKTVQVWRWPFPSDTKVMNVWSYTSTPPICLHVVQRDNFTLLYFISLYSNYLQSILKLFIFTHYKWLTRMIINTLL